MNLYKWFKPSLPSVNHDTVSMKTQATENITFTEGFTIHSMATSADPDGKTICGKYTMDEPLVN